MRRERLQRGWKWILALYLGSFVLPVGEHKPVGALIFLVSLFCVPVLPGLFLLWLANPLFWLGLASMRARNWARTAAFGAASCAFASIAMIPVMEPISSQEPVSPLWYLGLRESDSLCRFSGYFTWFASTAFLATSGLAGWLDPWLRLRPQFRLSWLMMAVAAFALALALSPKVCWVLKPLFTFTFRDASISF